MSGRVSPLNPCSSAATVYGPGGRETSRYSPLPSVAAVRMKPLSTFFAVTVAPGMTAPEESFTTPVICAFWAYADVAHTPRQSTNTIRPDNHLGIAVLLSSLCRLTPATTDVDWTSSCATALHSCPVLPAARGAW